MNGLRMACVSGFGYLLIVPRFAGVLREFNFTVLPLILLTGRGPEPEFGCGGRIRVLTYSRGT